MKKKNELISKSDVGLKKLYETYELVKLDSLYYDSTERIKRLLEDVFTNYTKIGMHLNKIHESKSYKLEDYTSIYEYGKDKFGLAETTVKNVMGVYVRFCNDRGYLLEEFKKYSFSALVEMISVDEIDIEHFKPEMTISQIRDKKVELKIAVELKDLFDKKDSFIKDIEGLILAYPFHEKLGDDNYKVIIKNYNHSKYDPESWRIYSFSFDFVLKNTVKLVNELTFTFSVNFSSSFLKFEIEPQKIKDFFSSARFEDINELYDKLDYIVKRLLENSRLFKSDDKKKPSSTKSVDDGPGHDLFNYDMVEKYNTEDLYGSWAKRKYYIYSYLLEYFCDYYVENMEKRIEFYKEHKRHKNKNPLLFSIVGLDDLSNTKLVIPGKGDSEEQRILLFDDIQDYLNKKLDKYFKKDKADKNQTTIFDFLSSESE